MKSTGLSKRYKIRITTKKKGKKMMAAIRIPLGFTMYNNKNTKLSASRNIRKVPLPAF